MAYEDIQTPCLILDLDALERNVKKMGDYARAHNMRHRAHGKMHKSVDVLKLQMELGGAIGVCCQKVSEAEVFARAGIKDILVSNQVRDPAKIDRLARLPKHGGRVIVCVDDVANVADLSTAAQKHGTDARASSSRSTAAPAAAASPRPRRWSRSPRRRRGARPALPRHPGLPGRDAAHGQLRGPQGQARRRHRPGRRTRSRRSKAEGLEPELVSGGGTGSYYFESNSGVYNELQCGSYAFMDADYGRIHDKDGKRIDQGEWENALFILTSVMCHAKPDKAICDAGLKAQSVDSGLPFIYGRDDVKYVKCSDEHGVIEDKNGVLKINEKLKLVPGHCDPTCNVHDWYVGVRNGKVESIWPVIGPRQGLLIRR